MPWNGFSGDRWAALEAAGASKQWCLWASTSTKNPEYRDVLYVESLIGPDTITTGPPPTLDAFRDHGRVQVTLGTDEEDAEAVLANGVTAPDAFQERLRERYPRAVVRQRELASEPFTIWYCYRDGRWVQP